MKLKRLIAGLIAIAMTTAMMPALVFADEGENGSEQTEPAAVETTEPEKKETDRKSTRLNSSHTT